MVSTIQDNMTRKKYILGNWKLYKNLSDITAFFADFNKQQTKTSNVVYGFAPTYLGLALAANLKKGQAIIMAQDVSDKLEGSYTGQISPIQLKDFGIKHCIVGHSETRKFLGANDEVVNKKVLTCLSNKIKPIICIGESLTQYKRKQTRHVLTQQLKTIFAGVKPTQATNCVIAYEPLWAIGTGITPTHEEITSLCGYIRKVLVSFYGKKIAEQMIILYGGSVNKDNIMSIIALKDVDGCLIGKASLSAVDMAKIIKEVNIWTRN